MNQRTRNIFLVLGSFLLLFCLWYFRSIVSYILIAFVVSLLGRPLVQLLGKVKIGKFSPSQSLCAMVTLVALWIVFFGFFRFIIPLVISEFQTLSAVDINSVIEEIEAPIRKLLALTSENPIEIENKTFQEIVKEQLGQNLDFSQISDVLSYVASTIGDIFIAIFSISFISFFFLKDEGLFKRSILTLVPSGYEERVDKILTSIHFLLRRYFIGIIVEVFMVGLLDTVGLTIVGIGFSHAVVIGLVAGLFNVIPYLGPWMGATFGIIIGVALNIEANFMAHTLPLLGFMLLVFVIVQVLDNILFQPLIYSSSVKAHPMEIFIVILIAGSLAGIVGMILAIPFYTVLRVVAKEFLDKLKVVRGLTQNLDA
ncbi:AI-2E family transporter [Puteibacter caeruleilacunae]|nr:AI-2E family transporter [Puteibacter caeruleilacunae]